MLSFQKHLKNCYELYKLYEVELNKYLDDVEPEIYFQVNERDSNRLDRDYARKSYNNYEFSHILSHVLDARSLFTKQGLELYQNAFRMTIQERQTNINVPNILFKRIISYLFVKRNNIPYYGLKPLPNRLFSLESQFRDFDDEIENEKRNDYEGFINQHSVAYRPQTHDELMEMDERTDSLSKMSNFVPSSRSGYSMRTVEILSVAENFRLEKIIKSNLRRYHRDPMESNRLNSYDSRDNFRRTANSLSKSENNLSKYQRNNYDDIKEQTIKFIQIFSDWVIAICLKDWSLGKCYAINYPLQAMFTGKNQKQSSKLLKGNIDTIFKRQNKIYLVQFWLSTGEATPPFRKIVELCFLKILAITNRLDYLSNNDDSLTKRYEISMQLVSLHPYEDGLEMRSWELMDNNNENLTEFFSTATQYNLESATEILVNILNNNVKILKRLSNGHYVNDNNSSTLPPINRGRSDRTKWD
ncbi:hypothetical protein SNEBB_006522 [Seison nebaliae]|nr:hypothetical protein SNEBB_006522 [Seison nebaliae]